MRFAYADPPYLGCGASHYGKHHPEAAIWDDPGEHRRLIKRLCDEFPDGWALSLHVPSLRVILNMCPDDVRVASWSKPFAAFKPGVTRAYTWEPVIFWGGREIGRDEPTWRDHISEPITMRKGLTGAKPPKVCRWILQGLGWRPEDEIVDLFPGTGLMGEVVAAARGQEPEIGLFETLATDRGGLRGLVL